MYSILLYDIFIVVVEFMDKMLTKEHDVSEESRSSVVELLKEIGYNPIKNCCVYVKDEDPHGIVSFPKMDYDLSRTCSDLFIEPPKDKMGIYVMAIVPDRNLTGQIKYLYGIKKENRFMGGIPLDRKNVRVYIGEPENNGDDETASLDDGYLTVPTIIDENGILLGLGIVDLDLNVIPGYALKEADDLKSLIEHPKLLKAINTIMRAEETYSSILPKMRGIAEKFQDGYYDGKDDIRMQGAITSPLPDGRHIVSRLTVFTCSEYGNIPVIDGKVYVSASVMTPYGDVFRENDENPALIIETSPDTIEHDVKRIIQVLNGTDTVRDKGNFNLEASTHEAPAMTTEDESILYA